MAARRWLRAAAFAAASLIHVACEACREPPAPTEPPAPIAKAPRVEPGGGPLERSDRAWYDLVAQRPSAVVLREGNLEVDLGRPQALKHVALGYRRAWELPRDVDGRAAGLVIGRTAAVDLPVDGALVRQLDADEGGGLALAITMHGLGDDQSVTVLWNEVPVTNLRLKQGWERRTISLPVEHTHPGDNRLRLHFRRTGHAQSWPQSAGAVERIELGPTTAIVAGRPSSSLEHPPYRVTPHPSAAIEIVGGTALAYYVAVPERGRLALNVRGNGAFWVQLTTDAHHAERKPAETLFSEALTDVGRDVDIDLQAWAAQHVRLEMSVRSQGGQARAVVRHASIEVAGVEPRAKPTGRLRDVVVVAVEGLRADAVFGSQAPPLPAIDAMRERSLVFERAYASSPAAVPSHAATLASVVPPIHLTVRGTFVADRQVLLPEVLARLDYLRTLVTTNSDLHGERGLLQGIDASHTVTRIVEHHDSAHAAIERSFALLGRHSGPWFSYLAINSPQAPYEPPRELVRDLEFVRRAPPPHMTHVWVGRVRMKKTVPSAPELAYVRRLYDGEVQLVDRALAELYERLRAAKREDAIVVVFGIHGEEFFEHGGAGHGHTLYEESLRVPLIIDAPGSLEALRRTDPVDLLDLAPTIADLLGVPVPDHWQGASLLGEFADVVPPRLVVSFLGDGSRAGIVGNHKLILGPGREEQFFDLRSDPKESADLHHDYGIARRILRTALAWELGYAEQFRRSRWGTGANLRPAFALDLGM